MKKIDLLFCGEFGKIGFYDVSLYKIMDSVHISKNNSLLTIVQNLKLEFVGKKYDFESGIYVYKIISCDCKEGNFYVDER